MIDDKNCNQIPSITIVIPCYKAEKYVSRAIDSILIQPLVNVEVIVVEDGVLDDTESVVSRYDGRVKFLSFQDNRGAPVARNAGLKEVKSEYVMFLDADDYLEGELLKGLWDTLQKENTSVAFGVCIKRWERKKRESIFVPSKVQTPLEIVQRWLNGNWGPGTCSILWRTSEIVRIGGWNTDLTSNDDGELIIRAMLSGCTVGVSERGAGIYWQHCNERVSKKIDPISFRSQEIIERFIQQWLNENGNPKEISDALNQFRIQIALHAYRNSLDDTGRYWEDKWKRYGGQPIALRGGTKGVTMRNLAARAVYASLGYRGGVLLLKGLRKAIGYCRNSISRVSTEIDFNQEVR